MQNPAFMVPQPPYDMQMSDAIGWFTVFIFIPLGVAIAIAFAHLAQGKGRCCSSASSAACSRRIRADRRRARSGLFPGPRRAHGVHLHGPAPALADRLRLLLYVGGQLTSLTG